MRVTKFVHSCLLVEQDDKAVLIDPGEFSWPVIDMDALPLISNVLITHIHPDHFDPEALKQILNRFPEAGIITNREVAKALASEGMSAATTSQLDWIEIAKAPHPRPPWADSACDNIVFHVFDLTHPGDSHSFTETKDILALPITAPWGSQMDALNLAIKLKPKAVLPIHDWHWNEEARQDAYGKAQQVLSQHGIRFIPLETGVSVEVDI